MADLNQGSMFKDYIKKYKKKTNCRSLKLISAGNLNIVNNLKRQFSYSKVVEGMTFQPDIPVDNAVKAKNMAELNELTALESKFNNDMKDYQEKYKKYLEELVTRQNEVNTDVKGKVINYNDGNTITKYYVNSQGVARKFEADSWQGRDKSSCSDPVKTVGGEVFSKLSTGPNMGIGEMCMDGGLNVSDNGGSVAWLDNLGYKHLYRDFRNKDKSCPDAVRDLTSEQFNAIPSGSMQNNIDKCEVTNLKGGTYIQLVNLNRKLMNSIRQMKNLVDKLEGEDKKLDNEINNQKTILMDKYSALEKEKEKIKKLRASNQTLNAETNELLLDTGSANFKYFIWAVVGGTFGYAIYKYSSQ